MPCAPKGVPCNPAALLGCINCFHPLEGPSLCPQAAPAKLSVEFGRELQLPVAAWRPEGLAAYLTFDQLCGRHGIEAHVGAAPSCIHFR